jgi:anthranilate synthase/aminodeoxychorismate synthase-like glutamine amidotransferase
MDAAAAGQSVLIVDNYDSFTYNLLQYLEELGAEVRIFLNDRASLAEIQALRPDKIVISPGPGTPAQAGISLDLVARFAGAIPILGVCLGHQAIAQSYGGAIGRAPVVVHGKVSRIHHDGLGLFRGIPNPFPAMRYHSLIVDRQTLPSCLEVSAWTADGLVMGLRHKTHAVEGIQFHPESILTPPGKNLLANFLRT